MHSTDWNKKVHALLPNILKVPNEDGISNPAVIKSNEDKHAPCKHILAWG